MPLGWKAVGRMERHGTAGRGSVSVLAVLAVAAAFAATPVYAETLTEALAAAYQYNPKIDAERARLRATDEEVPRASAGYRPQVDGTADYGNDGRKTKPETAGMGSTNPWGYEISLVQPIFSGFRTESAVNQAEANVRAGRQTLRQVETETLLEAVTAYLDVVRDQTILRFREHNVVVLTREVEAAEARRAAKEVTKTDVAQARARRARAVSAAEFAKANLKVARAAYERAIGHAPGAVAEPPLRMKLLPRSLASAIEISEQESPNVVSALYREEAARFNVDEVRGELLPEVRLEANYAYRNELSRTLDEQESASITGRINVPLYRGGEIDARVRQAKHTHVSRIQEIEQARTETREAVSRAWARLMASHAQLKSDQVQVEAGRTALDGVREEEKVGQRTLLDLLDAEQEYLDAAIQLTQTRRDHVLAGYSLLAAMGRLTGEALAVSPTLYDEEEHYHEVRQKWFGLAISHADGRSELFDAPDAENEPILPDE
ncbi:MAG: TolC family outer membrane protein [Hyphomicrobium sp.]